MIQDDQTKNIAIHDDASTLTNPLPVDTVLIDFIRRLQVNATISGVDVEVDVRSLKQKAADNGQLFTVSSNVLTVSGLAEAPLVLLRNPGGSGVDFKWDRIVIGVNETANTVAVVRIYRAPTITADGAALVGIDENDISSNTPDCLWFAGPTASAFGTFRQAFLTSNLIDMEQEMDLSRVIPPGEEMLITVEKSSGAATDFALTTWWIELPE